MSKVRESDKELAQKMTLDFPDGTNAQIIADHLAAERKAGERLCMEAQAAASVYRLPDLVAAIAAYKEATRET